MSAKKPILKFFLDEGVPRSVGQQLTAAAHQVIYLQDAIPLGATDPLVCAVSQANDAILVAIDGDMKALAQRRGVGQRRFRKLSLLKLSCRETRAASRIQVAMSLVEHEWAVASGGQDRRIFIDIGDSYIRTNR